MTDYIKQLHEKGKILEWLINGYGRIGLPISAASYLTKEIICKYWNVELSYFEKPLFIK